MQDRRKCPDVINRIETNDETTAWKKSKSATTAPTPKLRKNHHQKGENREPQQKKTDASQVEPPKKEEETHERTNLIPKTKMHIETGIKPTTWGNLKTTKDGQILEPEIKPKEIETAKQPTKTTGKSTDNQETS